MVYVLNIFFFKQKTAYEMRISDWSSDVCSSDLISIAWRGTKNSLPTHPNTKTATLWCPTGRAGAPSPSKPPSASTLPAAAAVWYSPGRRTPRTMKQIHPRHAESSYYNLIYYQPDRKSVV